MMRFKLAVGMAILSMFSALPSMAAYLDSCGGTIDATISSSGTQINFVARNVQNCKNLDISTLGKSYKLQGSSGDWSGSYTVSTKSLQPGYNTIYVTVSSNAYLRDSSRGHHDTVSLSVYVRPANPYARCARKLRYKGYSGMSFVRESNSGNYVYSDNYLEITVKPHSCRIVGKQQAKADTGASVYPAAEIAPAQAPSSASAL